jgi:Transposase and inactivated derivatives
MAKRYTEEKRTYIVALYQNGSTVPELCAKYGLSRSSLYGWIRQHSGGPAKTKSAREIYLLEKEIERLRITNEILINCGCSIIAPLQEKLPAIERLKGHYSIHALCGTLGVNRATFYNYLLRRPEKTMIQQQDKVLKPFILEIFEKSGRRFGARKIRAKLMENDYVISERRTARLMKEMGLSSKAPRRNPNAANDREYKYYPNRLKRQFLQEAPNLVWVSDITYVRVGDVFHYLCVVIDLFSRKVLSYAISPFIDTELVTAAFEKAFTDRHQPQGLMFHSDQGAQYMAYEFRTLLRKYQVIQSFSKPGVPFDNAVAESFFASIKKEEFRRSFYNTEEELHKAVREYIEYFNDYRPHQRMGFQTPNQVERDFYNSL